MIGKLVSTEAVGKPSRWVLCFTREVDSRVVRTLAFGRYKHVRAFGYVEDLDAWVFFERRFAHADIWVGRGAGARHMMGEYIKGADLLGMPVDATGTRSALGFWCVPAIKALIGLRSGALRPDRLYADCVAAGAEIIDNEFQQSATAACSAT